MSDRSGTRVSCKDCGFSAVVRPAEDREPAHVLIQHGEETGHSLSLDPLE